METSSRSGFQNTTIIQNGFRNQFQMVAVTFSGSHHSAEIHNFPSGQSSTSWNFFCDNYACNSTNRSGVLACKIREVGSYFPERLMPDVTGYDSSRYVGRGPHQVGLASPAGTWRWGQAAFRFDGSVKKSTLTTPRPLFDS